MPVAWASLRPCARTDRLRPSGGGGHGVRGRGQLVGHGRRCVARGLAAHQHAPRALRGGTGLTRLSLPESQHCLRACNRQWEW